MAAAFALPGALIWALIGLLAGLLPVTAPAVIAVAAYGSGYGISELSGWSRPAAPGSRWQVPQDLLIGASGRRRVITWGAILGPGFLTRNLYASFGMLVLLTATVPGPASVWIAALIGSGHAAGRAAALLRDSARPRADPFGLLLRVLHWRMADGLALLALAGAAIVMATFRL